MSVLMLFSLTRQEVRYSYSLIARTVILDMVSNDISYKLESTTYLTY